MKHSLNILIQYLYKPKYLLFIFVIAGKGQEKFDECNSQMIEKKIIH